jgi:hypothetical protein
MHDKGSPQNTTSLDWTDWTGRSFAFFFFLLLFSSLLRVLSLPRHHSTHLPYNSHHHPLTMSNIDNTPLTAASSERRNSLEKHLQTRPDMQDLKDRHILLDTKVAPYVFVLRLA